MAPKAKEAVKPQAGVLRVRVLSCKNLKNLDSGILGDVSDPYVVIRFAGAEKKTPVIDNNLNPTWTKDNEFSFDVNDVDASVELEVKDSNSTHTDGSLGKISFSVKSLGKSVWAKPDGTLAGGKDGVVDFEARYDAPAGPLVKFNPGLEKERFEKLVLAFSEGLPAKMAGAKPYVKMAAPIIAQMIVLFMMALPYIVQAANMTYAFIQWVPKDIIMACVGFIMCFFGGVFPATIAAFEAWKVCGGEQAIESGKELTREVVNLVEAHRKDDEVDADGDGIKDVDQMSSKALLLRKSQMAVKAIDPIKLNTALACLFTGWLGVLATLKIKFARTITLGNVIGDYLSKASDAVGVEGMISKCIPHESDKKWVPVILAWICKSIAISIAWWIERVISAFHSSIRGGLMFSRYLLKFLHEKKYVNFPDQDESYMDEVIGWSIAALGFTFQFMMGFSAPFPLNILLIPVRFVEGFIVWSVSS